MRQGVILSIIVLTIFCAPIFGYDWFTNPGDGSPENPYQISTPEQLMSIGSNADLLDKHFELTHDIVFDPNNNLAHVFSRALIAPDIDTSNSSSFDQIPFTGTFNGNGYSIRNLKILNDSVYENYLGLFGYVTGNSPNVTVISNLSIISAGIGKHRFGGYLGTLVGKFENGLIDNCHAVSVSVKGEHDLGGLVGYSTGSNFQNCSVSGQVTGSGFYCGGLVGQNDGGISNCQTNCTVLSDSSMVGGFIGDHRSGNIINCSAKGIVKGTSNVGGLVGVLD
ncbi:MAG: GLUG motif-containing protein, partial [Planctomycetota bacterium]